MITIYSYESVLGEITEYRSISMFNLTLHSETSCCVHLWLCGVIRESQF